MNVVVLLRCKTLLEGEDAFSCGNVATGKGMNCEKKLTQLVA